MPRPHEAPAAYRLSIEYDGSRLKGWQQQGPERDVRTVTGVLLQALEKSGMRPLALVGSGRTDAGVHAAGQVAHLHLPREGAPDADAVLAAFRDGLPSDVAVRRVDPCDPRFHARHDAAERAYLYQLCRRRTALARHYVWTVDADIDIERLSAVWRTFEGFRDVTAFASLHGEDPRCEIRRCEVAASGSLVLLRVTASHFAHRQARRMVGAAVRCGLGLDDPARVAADLATPTEEAARHWATHAAPPDGLFLERVRYPDEPPIGALAPITPVA
jgi:tRNA pseudouridine38-40 synthase